MGHFSEGRQTKKYKTLTRAVENVAHVLNVEWVAHTVEPVASMAATATCYPRLWAQSVLFLIWRLCKTHAKLFFHAQGVIY